MKMALGYLGTIEVSDEARRGLSDDGERVSRKELADHLLMLVTEALKQLERRAKDRRLEAKQLRLDKLEAEVAELRRELAVEESASDNPLPHECETEAARG